MGQPWGEVHSDRSLATPPIRPVRPPSRTVDRQRERGDDRVSPTGCDARPRTGPPLWPPFLSSPTSMRMAASCHPNTRPAATLATRRPDHTPKRRFRRCWRCWIVDEGSSWPPRRPRGSSAARLVGREARRPRGSSAARLVGLRDCDAHNTSKAAIPKAAIPTRRQGRGSCPHT